MHSLRRLSIACAAFLSAVIPLTAMADPPARVGRLAFLSGDVSFRSATGTEWEAARLNYPVTTGDHLWTDTAGRVEVQLGTTVVRAGANTSLSFLVLGDDTIQVRLVQGALWMSVRELDTDESVEIDTPNGALSVLSPGAYRVDVNLAGDRTLVTVRRGEADVATDAASFTLPARQSAAIAGLRAPTYVLDAAGALDEWEDWCEWRERRAVGSAAERYVSKRTVGYEDLDDFGTWQDDPQFGVVWVPDVRAGWVPYRFGHWALIEPWGWVWIEDAPWGYAPFHYGRWAWHRSYWVWVPGVRVARPVFAPALVVFVGGPSWAAGLALGEPIVWFPLGPHEPFVPRYVVGREYLRAVNRPHVDITTHVDVGRIDWVNRLVPGAATAVPRQVFAEGRPVARAVVRIAADAIRRAPVQEGVSPIVPPFGRIPPEARRVGPPASVLERPVVVRRPPPAAAVPRVPVREAAPPPARRPETQRPQPPASPAERGAPPAEGRAVPRPAAPPQPERGDLAGRQAAERARLEAEHAARQEELRRRQQEEQQRVRDERQREQVEQRQRVERQRQDEQQKRDHAQTDEQQQKARQRRPPRGEP
jgi:hypothetical protein